ncbi:MAG: magnesium chelatase subunit D family protein [Promethearchaeia archaeon]
MTHIKVYPFTAIVGQDLMKLALILNAINHKIGGVLIKGTKGTAKSTAVRALADLLPDIKVMKDCPFNCNPDEIKEACHLCQEKIKENEINEENIAWRPMRVINLPINATEDRVIGTIDIGKALKKGIKALEPGILADANRNILYIDEVNLLADNVADVLLDSAAMGLNIIEREGISIHHPANFILVGTMNPEEGNLRPQLLDRFGLSVLAKPIKDIEQRVKIIKYNEEYQENPDQFIQKFEEKQQELKKCILYAQKILNEVQISDKLLKQIAELSVKLEIESHRADITINRTAKTIAAFEGRKDVIEEDIKKAAKLALAHRIRKLPFEDEKLEEEQIEEAMNESQNDRNPNRNNDQTQELEPDLEENLKNQEIENVKEEVFKIDNNINANHILDAQKRREVMNTSGQRIKHPTKSIRGKYIGGQKPRDLSSLASHDIAVNETLNNASLEPENREFYEQGKQLKIKDENIHIKKRMGKSSYLIIFCVDASGSMGVNNRMEAVKGAIFSILQSNYVYRDKVSLVVFRKDKAEVVLPPTRSTDLAYKLLKDIPTGGTTPLVEGLTKAADLALEEKRKETGYIPLIVLLSDARGNVYYNDAISDILKTGQYIAKKDLDMIILDTEASDVKLEICKKLAKASDAIYYHIDELNESQINEILSLEGILDQKYIQ